MSDQDKQHSSLKKELMIVGIGASAGGVQALQEFFRHVPVNSGLAFVVILHLSPNHDSKLTEILRLTTKLSVDQVIEEVHIEPDHVYVVPPNRSLQMYDGMIRVLPVETTEERRAPVDIFFRSLADSHGPNAVGVILSGTGANGSMGIKRIKENGGVAFVQDPKEAEFNEMPRNSIGTELIDAVLPVAEIAAKIISYREGMDRTHFELRDKQENEDHLVSLKNIFQQLRSKTGHDFANYKRATMLRRIERRMNVRNIADLAAYATLIQEEKEEAPALLKDLLISVTNFFRDKNAFEYLERQLIPQLLSGKGAGDSVRIWVAGCATGEEAYSIAMLFAEQFTGLPETPTVQIFATDLDDHAIGIARDGLYTLNDAADVSPERLRRFFTKEGSEYRIRRELREMILFASHNLIKDPPFSHLDLATCRNLLIYLNHSAQKRVLETLHFALNPKGFLFLGSSESIEGSTELFLPFSKESHVFQSRAVVTRHFPIPDRISPVNFQITPATEAIIMQKKATGERLTYSELHQRMLEEYAPPSIVVNEEFDIVHLSEHAVAYLQMIGGEPTKNLLRLIRPELRLELRSALYQAIRQGSGLDLKGLEVFLTEKPERINIHIRPVFKQNDVAQGFILILFEKTERNAPVAERASTPGPVAEHLEEELVRSKLQLRTSVEQYEVQTEELKASNEELQAMNEELRSAAEELETSKEELQSINEELLTVNQELKIKIEELSQANNNFKNLINSTDIGTLFLDRAFRVNLFTPSVRAIFNLIPNDIGRPLSDISGKLVDVDLLADSERVLAELMSIEREVTTTEQEFFMMKIMPYRTGADQINGIVVTFVNITRLKIAEEAIRRNDLVQQFLLELSDGLMPLDKPDEIVLYAMKALAKNLPIETGTFYSASATATSSPYLLNWNRENSQKKFNREAGLRFSSIIEHASGESVPVSSIGQVEVSAVQRANMHKPYLLVPLKRSAETDSFYLFRLREGSTWSDGDRQLVAEVTDRTWNMIQKSNDQVTLQRSEESLRIVVESVEDYAIIITDLEGTITGWNPGAEEMFEYTAQEAIGKNFKMIFTPEDVAAGVADLELEKAAETGRAEDERWHMKKNGTRFYCSGVTTRLRYGMEGLVKIARDMTTAKLAEQQKDQFIGIASHELKTPVTSIKAYAEVLRDIFLENNDTQSADLMNRLDSQVDRLTALISHLLDTTRIAEGQLIFQPETFDLNELISDHLIDLQRVTAKHKLLQQAAALPTIYADRERIGQVLINLVTNAMKYSPDGGDILISTEKTREGLQVNVQDNGIGIGLEAKEKIFDRFFRTLNPKIHTFPGLGLGLYISAEIVKRHGGRIWVDSLPGKGSTFHFMLPFNTEIQLNETNTGS